MVLYYSISIIHRAQNLLALDPTQDVHEISKRYREAYNLITLMNFYYLSPVFLLCGGWNLHSLLQTKYSIKNRISFCDLLFMSFITLLCDELCVLASLTIYIYLMTIFWLPAWQHSAYSTAYSSGYNTIYGIDQYGGSLAYNYALTVMAYQVCNICRKGLYFTGQINGTYTYQISGAASGQPPMVSCPPIDNKTIHTIIKLAEKTTWYNIYVDKQSMHNSTYLTYVLHRPLPYTEVTGVLCNQTLQGMLEGSLALHSVRVKFVWYVIGITIGIIICYLLINPFMGCIMSYKDEIDPSNYQIIRVNKPESTPGLIVNV